MKRLTYNGHFCNWPCASDFALQPNVGSWSKSDRRSLPLIIANAERLRVPPIIKSVLSPTPWCRREWRLKNYLVNTQAMGKKRGTSQQTSNNCTITPADTKCPRKVTAGAVTLPASGRVQNVERGYRPN